MGVPTLKPPVRAGTNLELIREAEVSRVMVPGYWQTALTITRLKDRVDIEGLRLETRADMEAFISELRKQAEGLWE